jgi:tRNA threonylcarbamoyladenosine biosynthesis protein TsaE
MSNPELTFVLPDSDATDALGAALARALVQPAARYVPAPGAPPTPAASPTPATPPTPAASPAAAVSVTGAVLHLRGELGAGKTALARSMLRTLGITGLVRSPTYTLLETYPLTSSTVVHVDLYRVSGESAVEELGLRDWVGPDALVLIEWPERGGTAVPRPDLTVLLTHENGGRRAWLRGEPGSPVGEQLLDQLRKDASLGAYLLNFA